MISASLLFTNFSYIFPLIFHLPLPLPAGTKLRDTEVAESMTSFFVTGEFEIIYMFYVTGSNSFMFVSVTLTFGKLLYMCKYQRKYLMY